MTIHVGRVRWLEMGRSLWPSASVTFRDQKPVDRALPTSYVDVEAGKDRVHQDTQPG